MVVEVAHGGMGTITATEHGMDKLFGCGLAIGAGDAKDGDSELCTMVPCQLLQRRQHIIDHHAAVVHLILRVAEDTHCSPLFQCLGRESIAIESLSLECKKDAAGSNLPRVGSDSA